MYAALSLGRIEAKQIEDKAADNREIGSRIFYAGAHLVIVQGDIKTQVDKVL